MTQPSLFDSGGHDAAAHSNEAIGEELQVLPAYVDDLVDQPSSRVGEPTVDEAAYSDRPAGTLRSLPVQVVRSAKRRKTVHARVVNGVIEVRVPAHMSKRDEETYVAELVERLKRREFANSVDLDKRVSELARRFDLPTPVSIRFVDNQNTRWGSCSIASREIRLSSRLASYPSWVVDYVIVHELAHLVVPDHSPAFAALVDRYPRAERARGYLHAKSDGL